jgi:hypothetical protein
LHAHAAPSFASPTVPPATNGPKLGSGCSLAGSHILLGAAQMGHETKRNFKIFHVLLASLPARACFGPLFETQFRLPCLSVAGGLILVVILGQVRIILAKWESITRWQSAFADRSLRSLPLAHETRHLRTSGAQNSAAGTQTGERSILRSRRNCGFDSHLSKIGSARSAKTQNPGDRSPGVTGVESVVAARSG